MLPYVVALLVLILVSLFIDWQEVRARLFSGRGEPRIKKEKAPAQPRSAAKQSMKDFMEDVPMRSLPDPLHTQARYNDPVEPKTPSLPEPLQKLMDEADAHFRKGEYKAAEESYVKIAAEDPRCSKAYARLGVIYLELGEDYTDAEAAFRQALKTDPDNGNLLNNLGLVLYHQDKFAEAVRVFEQSVRLDEANASRHANLGMAYLAMRQYAKAESSFKKALKIAPSEMEYKDLLAEAVEKKVAHRTMVRR